MYEQGNLLSFLHLNDVGIDAPHTRMKGKKNELHKIRTSIWIPMKNGPKHF